MQQQRNDFGQESATFVSRSSLISLVVLCGGIVFGSRPAVGQPTIGEAVDDIVLNWRQTVFPPVESGLIGHGLQEGSPAERKIWESLVRFSESADVSQTREAAFALFVRRAASIGQTSFFADAGQLWTRDPDFFVGKPISVFARRPAADLSISDPVAGEFESQEGERRRVVLATDWEAPRWLVVDLPVADIDSSDSDGDDPAVELNGYFFKLTRVEVEGQWQSAALIAGMSLDPVGPAAPAGVLAQVASRTPLRASENMPYYRTLAQARLIDRAEFQQAAEQLRDRRIAQTSREEPKLFSRFVERPDRFPVFVDLFRHPEAYPGQPVTLVGRVRDVVQFPAEPNPYGLTNLFEVHMFPDDGQRYPAIIVCSELPEGFPLDAAVVDKVKVTGLFFKLYAYKGTQTDAPEKRVTRFAPMLLAGTLDWESVTSDSAAESKGKQLLLAVVVLLVAIPGACVTATWWRDRKARQSGQRVARENPFEAGNPAGEPDAEPPLSATTQEGDSPRPPDTL